VVFVTHDVQHLETLKPTWHIRPLPPIQRTMPTRPTIGLRPLESRTSGRWADPRAFLDDLLVQR
jgi:hypothetical protein